jgi:anaerobic magnesium-protoporphyrin IX monomethyl ester cyclase
MGILYIAAELQKNGYTVSVIDADIDGLTVHETVDRIVALKPDLVGFSIMTPQLPAALEASFWIKQLRPDLPVVLGGAHISATHADVLDQSEHVDFLIDGEGEITTLEICKLLRAGQRLPDCLAGIEGIIYRDADKNIVRNPPRAFFRELDEFAPLDYSMVDVMKYKIPTLPGPPVVGLMITRGCPFKCTYCDAPITTGKRIRIHSPARAVADIVRMNKTFGVRGFSFRDSTFTAKKSWVYEFCEKLVASGVKIAWRCNTRVDCVTEEMLALMKKSGCHTINFGVESLDPTILKRIKKDVPFEQVKAAHDWCRKLGIRTYTTFLVGSPGETDETIRNTIDRVKEVRPSMAMFFVTIAYPGTEMYDEAIAANLVEPGWWRKQKWDQSKNTAFEKRWGMSADAGALTIPGFNAQKWQRTATREFYLRPSYWLEQIGFVLKNPYFLKHALRLSWEVLPLHKLRLPWKKSRINEQHKIYSRCPEAATWDYERRKDLKQRAAVDAG